jgi:pimeloyl-ACP methyl ester carboxylesterase
MRINPAAKLYLSLAIVLAVVFFTIPHHVMFNSLMIAQNSPPALPPAPAQQDSGVFLIDESKPVFVIVHGAWGGSWAFREVEMLLREKGYDVYRPSLTGLGERYHLAHPDINLSTHITDVINTIIFEQIDDIILVGHSYGGMVITGVAHRIPERIHSMIYIDAFLPDDGESVEDLLVGRSSDIFELEQNGFILPAWVSSNQPFPRDVPHPAKTFTEKVVLGNEKALTIRARYIHAVEPGTRPEDDDFYDAAQRARERGWPVLIIDSDHNPQWSVPVKLVEMLHLNW